MSLSVGSPFYPPDETTIELNTATGKIQVKNGGVALANLATGTAGNLITYDAAGAPAAVATGTAGQYLKSNGAGAAPTFEDPASGEGWVHLETLNPSSSSSITSTGTLTVKDEYLILCSNLIASGSTNLKLRINGDTGNNYAAFYMFSTTPTFSTAQPNVDVVGVSTTTSSTMRIVLPGKTAAVASGTLGGIVECDGTGGNNVRGIGLRWTGGNATQVTSVTLLPGSGTFSGKIEIYGRTKT